jgi:hypothetical protein
MLSRTNNCGADLDTSRSLSDVREASAEAEQIIDGDVVGILSSNL